MTQHRSELPEHGTAREVLFGEMRARKGDDADWEAGRTFSLIYPASGDVDDVLREANNLYLFENALNPFRFPSLRSMESDVCDMTLGLLHAPDNAGATMSSGGTESILMATLVARERAKAERGVTSGRILIPRSAHPAFAKAAHLLGLGVSQIPLGDDFRADVAAAADLIDDDVVLMVGSAPGYPHGVVDPIPELAALAAARGIAFHTDACVGGFLLPHLEANGRPVPPFDFRVDGVTSMSADVHKYGYCTKGASVVAHRDAAWLQHQYFVYADWPGGLYGSPALAGARPAAPIAAAWAVMRYLGHDGYRDLARILMDDVVDPVRAGITSIPGWQVLADPVASVFAFTTGDADPFAVGDAMADRGWFLDRQAEPTALHVMLSPAHAAHVGALVENLRAAALTHGERRSDDARYN